MEFGLRLDQPDVDAPGASRRMDFGGQGAPAFALLNGRARHFEGGADEPALSLKWLPAGWADYRSEGRSYRIAGNVQLILNRGQPYRMTMRGPGETFVVFFPQAAADAAWQVQTGRAESLPEIPTLAAASPPAMLQRLTALHRASRARTPDGQQLIGLVATLLADVAAQTALRRGQAERLPVLRSATRAELLRRLVRAEGYLADVGAAATLSGAARAAALSPFHLIRLFDAVYGETPLAYAAGLRLEQARRALLSGRQPIAEVARAAGYASRTAFDRAFVRRFRVTPGAVRAR